MTDIDVALKGATLLPLETPHLVLSRTLDGPGFSQWGAASDGLIKTGLKRGDPSKNANCGQ
jgi:hypothetical protein